MGLTFKENCPDIRNTRVIDVVKSINNLNIHCDIFDPWIDIAEVKKTYGIDALNTLPTGLKYSAVLLAVAHRDFVEFDQKIWGSLLHEDGIIYDLKGIVPKKYKPIRL